MKPYLKNQLKAKGLGHGSSDSVCLTPEFNSQYHQKKSCSMLPELICVIVIEPIIITAVLKMSLNL
jgi:hypothetical protein